MSRVRGGGCRCGAVRFTLAGEPTVAGLCHCTDCRKATGSLFLSYAQWPRAAASIEGDYATYLGRSFCPVCGSRLFHLTADTIEVNLGTLDEAPNGIQPGLEVWTRRREAWLDAVSGATQHVEDPP